MSDILRGQALYNIIDNHLKQLNGHGLSVIDAATGYGKTTVAKKFILKNIGQQKFVYIVPQKKLFLKFEESDKINLVNLVPPYDTFSSNFSNVVRKRDDVLDSISNVDKIYKILNSIKPHDSVGYDVVLKLFQEEERIFRRELKEILKKQSPFSKLKKNNGLIDLNQSVLTRIELFFNQHQWIELLYPSVRIPFSDLIQMTVHKAYYSIDTLWFGHLELGNRNDSYFKNHIVFIDEFDSSKEILQTVMIESVINKEKIDVFESIKYLYASLSSLLISNDLPEEFYCENKSYFYERINQWVSSIKKIYTKYKLNLSLKYTENDKKNRFLFRDRLNYTVTQEKRNKLFLTYDEKLNCNIIVEKSKSKSINDLEKSFEEVCMILTNKINDLVVILAEAAKNYFKYYKKIQNGRDDMSIYEAASSILVELRIGKENEDYFLNVIHNYLTYNGEFQSTVSGGFLDVGFKYFCMENSLNHNMKSRVYYYHFYEIPEHFILSIAENNCVVGLSATATIETYVKNYDMHYLSNKLKDHFISISSNELNSLRSDFVQNTQSEVCPYFLTPNEQINRLNDFFDLELCNESECEKKDLKQAFISTYIDSNNSYRLINYTNLIEAFDIFCEKKIHAMICFLNFNIKNSKELNFDLLRIFLEKRSLRKGHKCNIVAIDSSDFDSEIEKIKSGLVNESYFVITTYKTLALGKNIQYEDENEIQKDFDGIYLDNITYPIHQVRYDDAYSLAEYLFDIEYLKYEKSISSSQKFTDYIIAGFKQYFNKGLIKRKKVEKELQSAKEVIYTKYCIQAIGRICRTDNKSPKTYIIINQKIKEALINKKKQLEKRMLNYEFEQLLSILPAQEELCEKDTKYYIDNVQGIIDSNKKIRFLSYSWWREYKKKEWIELREMVLKSPTTVELPTNNQYYCHLDKESNSYSYQFKRISGNSLEIYNLSSSDIKDKYSNTVSMYSCRLNMILKSDIVMNFFKEKGYQIEFKIGNYILNPPTFEKIYKGAIGEASAKAILEEYDINLYEIDDLKKFEKFDYFNGSLYYDIKNWSDSFIKYKDEMLKKIIRKAKKCGSTHAIIINVLKELETEIHETTFDGITMIEIPWLFDAETKEYNELALKKLKELQIIYGNIN